MTKSTTVETTAEEAVGDIEAASEDHEMATEAARDPTLKVAVGNPERTNTKRIRMMTSPTLNLSLPSKEKDTTRRRIWP